MTDHDVEIILGMRPQITNLGDAIQELGRRIDDIPSKLRPVASTADLDNKRLKAIEATMKLFVAELREIKQELRVRRDAEGPHETTEATIVEFLQ